MAVAAEPFVKPACTVAPLGELRRAGWCVAAPEKVHRGSEGGAKLGRCIVCRVMLWAHGAREEQRQAARQSAGVSHGHTAPLFIKIKTSMKQQVRGRGANLP